LGFYIVQAFPLGLSSEMNNARTEDAMTTIGKHTELTTNEAREGETTGHMRYVLGVSLALVVIAGIVLYFFYF